MGHLKWFDDIISEEKLKLKIYIYKYIYIYIKRVW